MDAAKSSAEMKVDPVGSVSGQESKSKGSTSVEDIELATALTTYIPGSPLEKKLVRKLDFILLPVLWWMYILAYIDRGNIANANAATLSQDLDLNDNDYSLIVSIFFIGYTIFEVPSNLLLNKFRPSRYLATIMCVWGVCVAAMCTCKTREHFLVGRFFLGCIEAGLFPGSLFLLTCWYTKAEIGKRFALFYTSGAVAPALGGIMAGAIISRLEGARGMAGWRWLFLIEGVATVIFSGVFFFLILDYPTNNKKFFSKEECDLAYVRNLLDRKTSVRQNSLRLSAWQSVLAVLADLRSYAFLSLYILDSTATSISYFIPVTLKGMGYTSVTAQWMTVPIWISGATIMVILSSSSDYFRDRRWHTVGCMVVGLICSIVFVTTTMPTVRYALLCFYIGCIYTAVAQILNWTSEEMALPDQKRAVALAFVNSWGNLSIIWGSRLWKSSENPVYQTGFTSTASITGAGAIIAALMPLVFKRLSSVPRTKAERDLLAAQEDDREE